ncbi:MAG: DUF192 domain-containing protein [Candidatus Levyibacteriota bacterium]
MKKYIFFALLFLFFIAGVILVVVHISKQIPSATIGNHTFSLFLAKTQEEREVGLARFSTITSNQGMLFFFNDYGKYGFWMKDMKFPIDILFIDNNKIVTIAKNVPVQKNNINLPIYYPKKPVNRVLEIVAGTAKKDNMQEGDSATFSL